MPTATALRSSKKRAKACWGGFGSVEAADSLDQSSSHMVVLEKPGREGSQRMEGRGQQVKFFHGHVP